MTKKEYVWEVPVRVTHWLNAICIVALSVTGLYIASPYMQAASEKSFIMASMRFIHDLAAYVFTVSLLVRMYWSLAGNRYSSFTDFFPFTGERCKSVVATAKYYCFLSEGNPHYVGHNGLAGITQFVLFIIWWVEILTGFALSSQSHAGVGFWSIGAWMLSYYSASGLRLMHHLLMWFMLTFVVLHVYISILNDLIEKDGTISSIFTGYKTVKED